MDRNEAIAWYRQINKGSGVDRYSVLDVLRRGQIAKEAWDDGLFSLGVEYGVMIALIKAFGLTNEDLYEPRKQHTNDRRRAEKL